MRLAALSDGGGLLAVLEGASRGGAGSVLALNVAADHQGVLIRELNVDILLGEASQLAMELIRALKLANVELGVEVADGPAVARVLGAVLAAALTGVGVPVRQKTEEGSEAGVGGVEVASEEIHC